jgi:hypothetical protein
LREEGRCKREEGRCKKEEDGSQLDVEKEREEEK